VGTLTKGKIRNVCCLRPGGDDAVFAPVSTRQTRPRPALPRRRAKQQAGSNCPVVVRVYCRSRRQSAKAQVVKLRQRRGKSDTGYRVRADLPDCKGTQVAELSSTVCCPVLPWQTPACHPVGRLLPAGRQMDQPRASSFSSSVRVAMSFNRPPVAPVPFLRQDLRQPPPAPVRIRSHQFADAPTSCGVTCRPAQREPDSCREVYEIRNWSPVKNARDHTRYQ